MNARKPKLTSHEVRRLANEHKEIVGPLERIGPGP